MTLFVTYEFVEITRGEIEDLFDIKSISSCLGMIREVLSFRSVQTLFWSIASMKCQLAAVIAVLLISMGSHAFAKDYQNSREAWNAGAGFMNAGNFAAAQEPLEAAFKLSDNEPEKMRIQRALVACYRLLPEPEKFIECNEYIILNSDHDATKSVTRSSLLSFMFQRGKIDQLEDRYQKNIKDKKQEELSHFMLSELYGRHKRNAALSIKHTEELAKLTNDSGGGMTATQVSELGRQYLTSKKYKEAAEAYEKAAGLDERTASWNWKEAAGAWMKLKQPEKTLIAIEKAEKLGPDTRSDQLTYYWHKSLADLLLELNEPKRAIPHLEAALKKTTIEGYRKTCEADLARARNLIQ